MATQISKLFYSRRGLKLKVTVGPSPYQTKAMFLASMTRNRLAVTGVVNETLERAKIFIRRSMWANKSGRIYKRPLKTYQASAPWESPAVYSHDLINNLKSETKQMPWGVRGIVGIGRGSRRLAKSLPYSKILEEGSPGGKIKPRPYLGPAKQYIAPFFNARIAQVFGQTIKGLVR